MSTNTATHRRIIVDSKDDTDTRQANCWRGQPLVIAMENLVDWDYVDEMGLDDRPAENKGC